MEKNKNLKIYPSETAGRKMIKNIPLAFSEEKICDVKKRIFEKAKEFETLNYIYVIDNEDKLLGVLSLKKIFQESLETKIGDLMIKEIVKVHPYTDQEKVAILALKYNLKAIPVVDKENFFLGVVSSDVILDILHSEHVEDFLKSAGIHSSLTKTNKGSVLFLTRTRIPWLVLGLFGGIGAAQIVNFFETPLKAHFMLAAFIPLIVYIADAVGTQTETLFIRNLVFDFHLEIKKYFFREIRVSILLALILSTLLFLFSLIVLSIPYFISLILGISLFFTVLSAISIGILVPFLLQKLKRDPAVGAGPFGTILRDILSLMIYFLVASLMLNFFI